MTWWQRVRQLDDRVNRRIGVAGTDADRAANSERSWWLGPVAFVVFMLLLIALAMMSDRVPATVLIPAVFPSAFVLFQSGFMYNERLRSLGEQSRWPQLRWRRHSHDTPVEPLESRSERL